MSKNEKTAKPPREKRQPTFLEAISTVLFLIALFGVGSVLKLNYTPLMAIVAAYSAIIAWRCGLTWKEMETAAAERIRKAVPVMTLFLAVGALVGAFMFSGTLPMFIYYGLQIVSPKWIALSAFLICAVFSIVTGTSNGSTSTAGLAMMGLAMSMENVNLGLVAGACLCGANFGDKLSPLSDTTVLSAMVTENDVFDHVRHQAKTVVPAAMISIVIYIIYGLNTQAANVMSESSAEMLTTLGTMYKFNPLLLLPLAYVLWGALAKKPPNVVLFSAALVAVGIGVVYQGFSLQDGVTSLYSGFASKMVLVGNPTFDIEGMSSAAATLINRGGIASMSRTFITCFIAMYFAGIAEKCGILAVLLDKIFVFIKSRGSLVLVSGISVGFMCVIGGSSTIGQIIGAELFKEKYEKMGMHSLNLARTLEDFGTGVTGFFPWTSSGMLYASVLSTSNFELFKYSYMAWIIWILATIYGFTGICIKPLDSDTDKTAIA